MECWKRYLAAFLCAAALILCISALPVPADAAESEIESTLDFSAMPQQDNPTTSVQLIKEAGAVDAVNLYVAGNYTPVANPGGYMGEGYYIQKLDAGAGKVFKKAYLDLIYWVGTAEPQGYLKVYASTDNNNYSEVFAQTEGNGDPWVETTRQSTSIELPMAEGAQTVYIKVVMQHWTTWEGAAVKTSTLRGTVKKDNAQTTPPTTEPDDTPTPPPATEPDDTPTLPPTTEPDDIPTKEITAKFDFSAMATDVEQDAVRKDLMSYGLHDCGNVQIGGNYGNVATPGGYRGEGFVVHKLSAPDGQTLVSAKLDLRYWAYNASGSNPGYLKVMASTDGVTYTELTTINGESSKSTVQSYIVDLPMAAGAKAIYVKVVMQHWESYEGTAVKKITITGRIPAEDGEISNGETGEKHRVEAFHAFSDMAFGEVEAGDIGADTESNMYFGIDGVALLTPRGGYETACAVWKLSAAKGETLDDAMFRFVGRTWYMTPDQKDNNTLKVLVSTDGENFTEVHCYKSNDEQSDTQVFELDLTEYASGASDVYVKMEWLLFDSPHVMGIRSVTLIGNRNGVEDTSNQPERTPVSNVKSFTSLKSGTVNASDIQAVKCANMVFGQNGTALLMAAQSGQDAFAIWELKAAEGETFDNGYLTLVGKITYSDEAKKDYTFMKILVSTDGEHYAEVETLRPVADDSDTLKYVGDLSGYIRGCSKVYVKLFLFTEEDPSVMGLRSLSLVGNTGNDYDSYTPPIEDVQLPEQKPTEPEQTEPPQTEPATEPTAEQKEPNQQPKKNGLSGGVIALIALGAVVLFAGGVVTGYLMGRKRFQKG